MPAALLLHVTRCSIFPLELHALTPAARSYALLMQLSIYTVHCVEELSPSDIMPHIIHLVEVRQTKHNYYHTFGKDVKGDIDKTGKLFSSRGMC